MRYKHRHTFQIILARKRPFSIFVLHSSFSYAELTANERMQFELMRIKSANRRSNDSSKWYRAAAAAAALVATDDGSNCTTSNTQHVSPAAVFRVNCASIRRQTRYTSDALKLGGSDRRRRRCRQTYFPRAGLALSASNVPHRTDSKAARDSDRFWWRRRDKISFTWV